MKSVVKVAKYKPVVVVIDNPYNPASEFVVILCSDSVVRTVLHCMYLVWITSIPSPHLVFH